MDFLFPNLTYSIHYIFREVFECNSQVFGTLRTKSSNPKEKKISLFQLIGRPLLMASIYSI